MSVLLPQSVTWIKVDKPSFDLVGLVLGAFGLAAVLVAVAFVLGVALGVVFILRRRGARSWDDRLTLRLEG